MKKIIFTFIVFFNVIPFIQRGGLHFIGMGQLYAQTEDPGGENALCVGFDFHQDGEPQTVQEDQGDGLHCVTTMLSRDCVYPVYCNNTSIIIGLPICGLAYTVTFTMTFVGPAAVVEVTHLIQRAPAAAIPAVVAAAVMTPLPTLVVMVL